VRVALVEFDAAWEDPEANRARLEVPGGADVAVLPEMALTGFSMRGVPDGGAEEFFSGLARRAGTAIVAGYVGEGPRNMALAAAADGEVLARYAKIHLFSYAGEHEHYEPGAEVPVFGLAGARCAVLICYDLRFPEPFRAAARKGAEVFFVLANWPAARVAQWHALLRARAIENQAFVVGVNRTGEDPNVAYASSSLAVGPQGETLHEGEGIAVLDLDAVRTWRAEFPALRDARW